MTILAKWISAPLDTGSAAVTFRRDVHTEKKITKAELCASALGVYAAFLNGARVGKGVLAPGWTSYNTRVQYQTYDLTDLLTGDDHLEIGVGPGWAVGFMGWGHVNHYYHDKVAAIAALTLTYADGTREVIATDGDWEVYTSHVTSSDIYHGETVDLTAPITSIGKAELADITVELIPQVGEWITEHERLAPIEVIRTPKGETVVDFGQNMTGYVEFRIKAPRGSRIVVHHAEVLDRDGNFYNENYRKARNENIFVCSGGDDVFKPTYSFQGFRYIRLEEYPFDTVDVEGIRAIAVHSELRRTGRFVCGNEKINQLYHNVIWGQKSNYLDIPTDCPQRDERLGWTGDTQVFCRTGAINYDVEKFFTKWLGDVAIEQSPEGAVAGIVPHCLKGENAYVSAAWGDVACIAPWQIYLAYGNKALLSEHFPMMKKWVDYLHSVGPEEFLWLGGNHYGDWLAMDGDPEKCYGATAYDLIASAFFAYSTSLLIKAGEVLGKDMSEYRALYTNVRKAFRAYFMENGMPKETFPFVFDEKQNSRQENRQRLGMTQTALVLILHFDLCEANERAALAAKLVEMIRENGMRMTTGFVGTPYLLHVLSDNGYTDVAYELLFQEKNPSWLYSVTHGATTIWEHWNGIREDGTFWDKTMNSFNHYAYGAVFDWIFGVACGITPTEHAPAYREVAIAPKPDKRLGFVDTSIDTRNGTVRMHWYYKENTVYYEIEIPEGVTAYLTLPSGYSADLTGGCYHFAE
ncbi:MAG: family 78 glycoside hydrolase catalytic domain [Clostridia bacterium]|nr:family 78 glycoside hydrolase catalytic domain [Clostridia bacterium]